MLNEPVTSPPANETLRLFAHEDAVEALPDRSAVMVPAAKSPEPSRLTILPASSAEDTPDAR